MTEPTTSHHPGGDPIDIRLYNKLHEEILVGLFVARERKWIQ